MIAKAAQQLNGISIAYIMGVANGAFAALTAFGVTLTTDESAALLGLLNGVLILASHIAHRVGEATGQGTIVHPKAGAPGTTTTTTVVTTPAPPVQAAPAPAAAPAAAPAPAQAEGTG